MNDEVAIYVGFGYLAFAIIMILLQIRLGVALIGLKAGDLVVEREKNPQQFWFWIVAQTLGGIVFPILIGIALALR